jgi:hypothetical protein
VNDKRPKLCPFCNRPLPPTRLGIQLPELKVTIFDLIQRAGPSGILMDDLHAIVRLHHAMSNKTLKAHFFQINQRIASTGYRIISRGRMVRLVSVWTDNYARASYHRQA